jgi:hypothetical protein
MEVTTSRAVPPAIFTPVRHRAQRYLGLTRRFLYRRPVPFRTVRDLGLVTACCPSESGAPESCSSPWLPAWFPAGDSVTPWSSSPSPGLFRATGRSGTQRTRRRGRALQSAPRRPGPRHCPVTARTVQGMARVGPGRLRPGPCLLTGVSVEAPGSSMTSRVRSPGTFRLCWLSCGYSHA